MHLSGQGQSCPRQSGSVVRSEIPGSLSSAGRNDVCWQRFKCPAVDCCGSVKRVTQRCLLCRVHKRLLQIPRVVA